MWNTIVMNTLLTVHSIDDPFSSLDPAMALAKTMDAHLDIVVVGVLSSIPSLLIADLPYYGWVAENDEEIRIVKEQAARIEEIVQEAELSASVNCACCQLPILSHMVHRNALVADLIVLPAGSVVMSDVARNAFYGATFKASRPALMLTAHPPSLTSSKQILMAWDGEAHSAAAIHESISWLPDDAHLHVAVVDPTREHMGPNPGNDIATFLARRNFKVTVDRLASEGRPISSVLIKHATDIEADLIVMGAYGHSRLKEWLLGGTTREMLEQKQVPVFLAH